jgi:hypothetical protein
MLTRNQKACDDDRQYMPLPQKIKHVTGCPKGFSLSNSHDGLEKVLNKSVKHRCGSQFQRFGRLQLCRQDARQVSDLPVNA